MDECFITTDGWAVVEDCEEGRGCVAASAFFVDEMLALAMRLRGGRGAFRTFVGGRDVADSIVGMPIGNYA